ncbi:hypothetical protein J5N97_020638 [Dioscorea zingiberensis]|uniref:Uncharacterized protein n=1 Tax=Dioscorea zingiberensis TaxID=325984 RepID=A0A9D5HDM1_9LILI|nr:hypothetical protein J5N97_020638 [Dioscorea zingiberensis]
MDLPPASIMDPSGDDLPAPDSWEMADLDESMSRLLLSTSKKALTAAASSSPPGDFDDDAPTIGVAAATAVDGGDRGRGIEEDAVCLVDQFLREALEKPRERLSILRMEQDIEKFIRDPTQQELEFQGLPTSYLRLAAHRVAQHYYLQSVAIPDNSLPDGSGSRIVLRKTTECRFPLVRLADIPINLPQEDGHNVVKVAIKQRPQKRTQTMCGLNSHSSKTNYQKSVEERKEEYNRARARIFNSNNSSIGIPPKSESELKGEPILPESLEEYSLVPSVPDEKSMVEELEISRGRSFGDSSISSNRVNRNRIEKEPVVSRYKPGNRVAIFRDREVDRKDPDYDRSYERYMQRFDPGFGFNGGAYTIQPMYSPAVNYNTEFPQLGSGHRPPVSIDHHPRPIPQHLRPWSAASSPVGYGHPEGVMGPFGPNQVSAHAMPSIYMHSQYSVPPRPGMPFVQSHEHLQPFSQTHQQPTEQNFGLARPR